MVKLYNIVIIQRISAAYRVPFYERLHYLLQQRGIALRVFYGQPHARESDEPVPSFPCGMLIRNRYITLGSRFLVWQPVLADISSSDLVIVQQASRNIINYLLPLGRALGRYKLAYWGHGRNFQAAHQGGLAERAKFLLSRHVDHWFAYNDLSKQAILDLGYPAERITSVGNTIDTATAVADAEAVTEAELGVARIRLGIDIGAPTAIFCSRLYPTKRLPFLFRSAERVREMAANFHLIIAGDGPDSDLVAQYQANHSQWCHWVGSVHGKEKALYFKLANFNLMPGPVGLHIVDSIAAMRPLITTNLRSHGPEIAHLNSRSNGLITPDTERAYADAIVELIRNPVMLADMRRNCEAMRAELTIESMASNFAAGVLRALSQT